MFALTIALSHYLVKKVSFDPIGFARHPYVPIANAYCMYYTVASTRYDIALQGTNDDPNDNPMLEEHELFEIPYDPASRPS